MRVLLVNPPYLKRFSRPQRSPAVTKSGTLYFPMWLAYAAAYLEQQGVEVDLVDAPADGLSKESVIERAKTFNPQLLVLDTSTTSIYNDAQIAGELKQAIPGVFTVLVGTHVSALPEQSLRLDPGVDALAVYEYEYTLAELADALSKGAEWRNIDGLCFLKDGRFTQTPRRKFIEDLDALPFVSKAYKKFLHIENYFNPNSLFPMVTVTTSRGCPFRCTFCVYPQTLMGRTYRKRSVENVADEMKYIIQNFPKARSIFFEDDTITVNKERMRQLCECILQRNIRIPWTANARVGVDLETMKLMKRAGCRTLCVGFESGSQTILDNIRKNIAVDQMKKFSADAKKAGIMIHGCFMAGLPGETRETLKQTLDLAIELEPDTAQFYPIMVYPGTEAYAWYKEKGFLTTTDFRNWLTPAGLHNTVIKTEHLSPEELVNFCDDARRRFYLRPKYFLRKAMQMVRHPREIRRNLKAARTFLKYLVKGSDLKTGAGRTG